MSNETIRLKSKEIMNELKDRYEIEKIYLEIQLQN